MWVYVNLIFFVGSFKSEVMLYCCYMELFWLWRWSYYHCLIYLIVYFVLISSLWPQSAYKLSEPSCGWSCWTCYRLRCHNVCILAPFFPSQQGSCLSAFGKLPAGTTFIAHLMSRGKLRLVNCSCTSNSLCAQLELLLLQTTQTITFIVSPNTCCIFSKGHTAIVTVIRHKKICLDQTL